MSPVDAVGHEDGRHPAGCVFGGPEWGQGYWLKVDGCPLEHPQVPGPAGIVQACDARILDVIIEFANE